MLVRFLKVDVTMVVNQNSRHPQHHLGGSTILCIANYEIALFETDMGQTLLTKVASTPALPVL